MALAGRSARRGGTGARWIAVGLVIAILVLLVDASLHSRSTKPIDDLAAGAWTDRILPIVAVSTAEGRVVAGVWTLGLKVPPASTVAQIDQVAQGSAQAYQEAVHLRPPAALAGAAGLLEASLLSRSQAAASLDRAMKGFLLATAQNPPPVSTTTSTTVVPGGSLSGAAPPPSAPTAAAAGAPPAAASQATTTTSTVPSPSAVEPPVSAQVAAAAAAVQSAGDDMQVGDQAYRLFEQTMAGKVPPSRWLADATPYQTANAEIFLASFQNSIATAQIDEVRLYSVSTTPSPVSVQNGVQILPQASQLLVTVVVANTGNRPAPGLTVTASISPVGSGAGSVRDFVDLQPGQVHAIVGMGPVAPPQGVPVTLTIAITPPKGSALPAVSKTLVFEMPTANFTPTTSTTSTTVAAPASATVPPTTAPGG